MTQIEHTGRGSIKYLVGELARLSVTRLLVVTGMQSYVSSGANDVIESLPPHLNISLFSEFTSNPTLEEASIGVDIFRENDCDGIVAIGGGSVIDIAKSINALQAHSDVEIELVTGKRKVDNPLPPLIAIPTTGGTGSEATHFAVLYYAGEKYSLASDYLLPTVAIVDPVFTDRLPSYISACTGFDALSQAIESYWSVGGTVQSKKYAAEAIVLLISCLERVVNGDEELAKDAVMRAANLSGKAINISKTTAPHALSYEITKKYGIPHGHAVALTLGQFFMFHEEVDQTADRLAVSKDDFRSSMSALYKMIGVESGVQARDYWFALMQACGLEISLANLGLRADDLIELASGANVERLRNHPVRLEEGDLTQLLTDLSRYMTTRSEN
jgi:alcohol dehydrogenase class IV